MYRLSGGDASSREELEEVEKHGVDLAWAQACPALKVPG